MIIDRTPYLDETDAAAEQWIAVNGGWGESVLSERQLERRAQMEPLIGDLAAAIRLDGENKNAAEDILLAGARTLGNFEPIRTQAQTTDMLRKRAARRAEAGAA